LHVQDANRFTDNDRQIQLDGPLNFPLFTLNDLGTDGLRRALHRFGGDLQAGQQLHLLPPMIERSLLTHQSVHAAHARRKLRILNVQFDIGRELAGMALRAQIVGPPYFHLAHRRENRLGTQLPVMSLVAARARDGAVAGSRSWELQELGHGCCARLVHSGTHSHFDGLQVQTSRFAATGEDRAQELLYLVRDFLTDRFGRFFSCGERVSWTGRARQISAFTSMKARLNS